MKTFLLKSVVRKIITLFFISVISFLIIHLAPGDPSRIDKMNPKFSKASLEQFRKRFHLDKPLTTQYYLFYRDLFTGDLVSFKDEQPVIKKIGERFLNSLPLFIAGTLITWTLAFPLGIHAAMRRGRFFDQGMTFLSYALISIPGFFLAYIMIIFVVNTFHVPVIGMRTAGIETMVTMDRLWHIVLPALLGATGGIAVLSRYVRGMMLEVQSHDYIRTARAKGLHEDVVNYKHALRNAMMPFVTMFGMILPGLIGGSVITETIFAWPGMGRLDYDALIARDLPVVLAVNFIAAVLVLIGTFVSDLLYVVVDPRVKYD